MISFPCPACGRTLIVKDEFAGKSGNCPHCKQRMKVPTAAAAAEAVTLANAAEAPAAAAGLDFLAPPQAPGELGRLGSYRVLRVLGAGGMGMVLMAEDPMLKRSVALKVMRPELAARPDARQRFLREAQATAAIEHPHIVHLYQVGEDRGVPFIAMPFLKGESLDDRLKRDRRLPVGEVVRLGRQIAEGLAAAHRNGLIHRDIKPANIWLETLPGEPGGSSPRCHVKILDFGLARAVADDDGQLTKTGAILGTPAYMAPEQARSEKVDHRCDLFSLGAVLYRMLTGETPFKGTNPIALIAALALDTPRPVQELNPETPPALADLVTQLLAKDPAGRPASARAVADALAAIEEDRTQVLAGGSQPTPAAQPGGKRPRRWLLPLAGGVVLLGLVVLALIMFARPAPPASTGVPVVNGPSPPPAPDNGITNSIGMKLVRIEPGRFIMGSPPDEKGRNDDEDAHEVAITKPFYLGAYPVTVGQFKAFVLETNYQTDAEKGGEGSYYQDANKHWQLDPKQTWRSPPFVQADDEPVVCVSWSDAVAFCAWLSKKEGKPYGLPSEAQWEYACRAGSHTKFFFGDNDRDLIEYAWYAANSQKRTHPVARLKPNAWGLYDISGNVLELTSDWYGKDYYTTSPREDPPGPGGSDGFSKRGGSYFNTAGRVRAATRSFNATKYRGAETGFRVALLPEQTITNGLGMKLAWIPAGKFTMGSPPGEPGRKDDEGPRREVTISRPMYVGTYLVTVGEFRTFVEAKGYKTEAERNGKGSVGPSKDWKQDPTITWQNPGWKIADDQPVTCMTWYDAVEFCAWLSDKEGRKYRLPTEAEWEYACRAGTTTVYSFGDDPASLGDYAWYPDNAHGRVHEVAGKKPNAWGLFDMQGDVWEWCADWYGADAYQSNAKQDPQGPESGSQRVIRGGAWAFRQAVAACRAANRGGWAPDNSYADHGFRVVLEP